MNDNKNVNGENDRRNNPGDNLPDDNESILNSKRIRRGEANSAGVQNSGSNARRSDKSSGAAGAVHRNVSSEQPVRRSANAVPGQGRNINGESVKNHPVRNHGEPRHAHSSSVSSVLRATENQSDSGKKGDNYTGRAPSDMHRVQSHKLPEGNLQKSDDNNITSPPVEYDASESFSRTSATGSGNLAKEKKKKDNTPIVVSLLKSVIYIVSIAVIAAFISIFVINMGNDIFAFVKSDEIVEVEIPDNPDIDDISDVLYDNGIIKYPSMFKAYAKFKKMDDNFLTENQGKVFTVSPSMNYDTLLLSFKERVDKGRTWITIPEGYTVDEIISLMLSYGIGGSKEEYVDVINNYDFDYWFVEELDNSGWSSDRYYRLEGYLFPDTYEFYNNSSALTVVNKLLRRFDQVYVEDYKEQAVNLGLTTDQVVILASIIEKEAGSAADYRNVSSVFHNRLNNPRFPKFESDATIMYAIQHDTGERPERLTDTNYASPYNTYKNDGFPPGPIANPSASALRFAISPAKTNFYYFVSGKGGYTYFASTKAEHDRNIELAKAGIINDEG